MAPPRSTASRSPSCTSPSRCMRAPTPASCMQIDADLLEDAGADAAEHVLAGLALEDHRVDRRPWPGAGPAAVPKGRRPRWRPGFGCEWSWGRSPPTGSGVAFRRAPSHGAAWPPPRRARTGSRAAPGRRRSGSERAPTPPEKMVTISIAGGSGPRTSTPSTCEQLRELLKAQLNLASGNERGHRYAGGRRHDPVAQRLGDAPALEQPGQLDPTRAGRIADGAARRGPPA